MPLRNVKLEMLSLLSFLFSYSKLYKLHVQLTIGLLSSTSFLCTWMKQRINKQQNDQSMSVVSWVPSYEVKLSNRRFDGPILVFKGFHRVK